MDERCMVHELLMMKFNLMMIHAFSASFLQCSGDVCVCIYYQESTRIRSLKLDRWHKRS